MKTLSFDATPVTPPVRRSLAGLLFHGLHNAAGGFIREMRIRRDMRHLESLSDNILSDIGISRGQITNALRRGRISPEEPRAVPLRASSNDERTDMSNIVRFVRPAATGRLPLAPRNNASTGFSVRQ